MSNMALTQFQFIYENISIMVMFWFATISVGWLLMHSLEEIVSLTVLKVKKLERHLGLLRVHWITFKCKKVIKMGYLDTIGGTPQHDPLADSDYGCIPQICETCEELEDCEFLDRDELCKKAMKIEKKRQKEDDTWADGYYEYLVKGSCPHCGSFSTEYCGGSWYCNDCKKMFEINKLHMLKKSISVHIFYMMRFFKTIKRAFVRRWSR